MKNPQFADSEYDEVADWLKSTRDRVLKIKNESLLLRKSTVKTRLLDYRMCEGTAGERNEFTFISDERDERPKQIGSGAYPLEYFLSGMGFCENVQYGRYAPTHGVKIKSLETQVEGWFDFRGMMLIDSFDPSFTRLTVTTRIESDATQEAVKALASDVHRACAVYNTLKKAVAIETAIFLNNKELMQFKSTSGNNIDGIS